MYTRGVIPITNVIVVEAFNQRKQANEVYQSEIAAAEASVPAELRNQYLSVRREFSSMLDHAIVDACLEHNLDMDISRTLAPCLDGRDVPVCCQQDIAELEACYDSDLLHVASLAVDFEGWIKIQLIPTESGYSAKWYYLHGV